MGQEFVIKSQNLEDKINQLLPSQGGFQAGVDLSASTQIIPIVDLTETAEGSLLRQDLQTAFGINCSVAQINNSVTTIINTTGYYRLFGHYKVTATTSTIAEIQITDGTTTKNITRFNSGISGTQFDFDFIIFLDAGHSCVIDAAANAFVNIASRQIATVSGELVNP